MRSIRAWFTVGIAAFLIFALAVAGLLIARGVDLTAYRPEITAQMEVAIGRTFEIGDELKLGFRRGLVIAAHDVKMGNADWGSEPIMLQVRKAELRLALYSLLQGELRIEHIAFEGPNLLLETDEFGRGNWEFNSGGDDGHGGLDVASISIESGSVEWRGAPSSAGEPVKVSNISLEAKDDGLSLALTADARVFGKLVQLHGHVASPRTWKPGQPIDLDIRLGSEAGDVQIKGMVQSTPQGIIPRLSLAAEQLEVGTLAKMVGHDTYQFPEVDVTLALTRQEEAWNVVLHNATVGSSDLAGSIQFEGTPDRPRISGSLTANRIELGELLSRPVETPSADVSDQRIFSSTPIDLAFLDNLDVDVELRAARLGTPKQNFRDLQLQAKLKNNRLTFRVNGTVFEGKGELQGALLIDADERVPSWSMNLALTQYPASALQRVAAITAIDAPVDLTLDVKARGVSPQQMAESLSGKARIVAGKGRVRLKTVDNLVGGLSTVAGQIFEEGTNDTHLNCVIGDLKAKKGVVTTQVAMIDSAASTLRVDGMIDLGREKIDLMVTPRPKKPTLNIAVPVHIQGRLQDPEFEPDRTSSLAKLIGVGSLLIYPPAAVVALGDLGETGNACTKMIDSPSVPEKKDRSPLRRVAESIGDTASEIGLGIKRLFGD